MCTILQKIYPWAHRDCIYVSISGNDPFFLDFSEAPLYALLYTTTTIHPTSKQTQRPRMDLEIDLISARIEKKLLRKMSLNVSTEKLFLY